MSNYGWTNEAGEPIMSGEAYRFEQQLDADYAEQRWMDDFYEDDHYEPDEDEEEPIEDDDAPFVMEDQWLDGSYEE